MANEIVGAKSYLNLITESTWGTKPGTPSRVYVPVEDYGVQFQTQKRQGKPYLGLYQRKHGVRRQGHPAGQIVANLYGYQFGVDEAVGGTTVAAGSSISIAEYLLDWAIADEAGTIHEARDLPSKTAEWAEGPDVSNVEHNGLRVNQATLSGGESSGVVQLALDVLGKSEANLGSAATIPTDHEELVDMEFADVVFKLDDGAGGSLAALSIASFQLQVQHNLIVKYNNADNPTLIVKGDRLVTLQVTIDKNANTYDAFRRTLSSETDFVGQLIVQGLNNGTGASAWTIGTMDFAKLRYVDHQDTRGRDALFQQPLQFMVHKPDASDNDIDIAWTESGSKAS